MFGAKRSMAWKGMMVSQERRVAGETKIDEEIDEEEAREELGEEKPLGSIGGS
jgi:hypothetical protein